MWTIGDNHQIGIEFNQPVNKMTIYSIAVILDCDYRWPLHGNPTKYQWLLHLHNEEMLLLEPYQRQLNVYLTDKDPEIWETNHGAYMNLEYAIIIRIIYGVSSAK